MRIERPCDPGRNREFFTVHKEWRTFLHQDASLEGKELAKCIIQQRMCVPFEYLHEPERCPKNVDN